MSHPPGPKHPCGFLHKSTCTKVLPLDQIDGLSSCHLLSNTKPPKTSLLASTHLSASICCLGQEKLLHQRRYSIEMLLHHQRRCSVSDITLLVTLLPMLLWFCKPDWQTKRLAIKAGVSFSITIYSYTLNIRER